jgi:hypothetical protein
MKKLYAHELSPGMLIGREVMSGAGMVLLEKGTRLTQSQINQLLKWGVSFVYVEEAPEPGQLGDGK